MLCPDITVVVARLTAVVVAHLTVVAKVITRTQFDLNHKRRFLAAYVIRPAGLHSTGDRPGGHEEVIAIRYPESSRFSCSARLPRRAVDLDNKPLGLLSLREAELN
jgi:hypothetical protein